MKPIKTEIVSPSPFFKIAFGCTNRAFYGVKNELLYEIGQKVGIDPHDGYMEESCDYEGDLEEIRIYRGDRSEAFITAILDYYDVTDPVPKEMDIVLSIF
tara:strand:+ start:731 stop:1030 length:300 start_codon:yes stop_codon:yes gene_type:complete